MADDLPGHDKFCRHCGYDLFGLSENRCPECGNTFDPANPKTFFASCHTLSRRYWRKRIASLMSVLILLLGIGVFSLWYPWHREQAAVQMVQRFHGPLRTKTVGPTWLQKLLGRHGLFLLERVVRIDLSFRSVTDADVAYLNDLTKLQDLDLRITNVTDANLEHLNGLTGLQELYLGGTNVTDAGLEHLKGLTGLRVLWLDNTKITDAGLEHIKRLKWLQVLGLNRTTVTDAGLQHLKGLTQLQRLYLNATQVTDAGVAMLQKALPGCHIYR